MYQLLALITRLYNRYTFHVQFYLILDYSIHLDFMSYKLNENEKRKFIDFHINTDVQKLNNFSL